MTVSVQPTYDFTLYTLRREGWKHEAWRHEAWTMNRISSQHNTSTEATLQFMQSICGKDSSERNELEGEKEAEALDYSRKMLLPILGNGQRLERSFKLLSAEMLYFSQTYRIGYSCK